MSFDQTPLVTAAGEGAVGRWPGVIAVAGSVGHLPAVDAVDPLSDLLDGDGPAAVAYADGESVLVAAVGNAFIEIDGTPVDELPGAQPVPDGAGRVVLSVVAGRSVAADSGTDLRAGIVTAGAAALVLASVATPDFVAVDLTAGDIEEREPLPIAAEPPASAPPADGQEVMGIHCSRGHFNNPDARYCQVCGVSMVHLTRHLVPGLRPTLGFLVFDDGATYALDAEYRVGRSPTGSPDVRSIVVRDDHASVSSDHATVTYDGWSVLVTDLDSTNGTYVSAPGSGAWQRLAAGAATALEPGSIVALGQRTFVFESVTRTASTG